MSIAIARRVVPAHAATLAAAGVDRVLARLLAARGIVTADELDDGLACLPPYASLRGIDEAADRLVRAIVERERILVVADYDADGATACAVALRGLRAMGAQRRLPRAQPVSRRLRPHAGDRGAGRARSRPASS